MMYPGNGQQQPREHESAHAPAPAPTPTPTPISTPHPSGYSSFSPTPPGAQAAETTAPNGVSADELAKAISIVERRRTRGKIARRALVGVAAVGICAGAVEFGPGLLQRAGEYTKAELDNAFQSGVEAGRQALLAELAQLEGVTLDGAIGIAKLTQLGIKYIVVPLARLTSTIEGDALQVLVDAIATARTNLSRINVTVSWLDSLQTLLSTWQTNVQQLPQDLNTYANTDVTSAETYLEALQTKIRSEQSAQAAQATPSPTK